MTDLHKLLGINKKHVIAVSIPASEYFSFCSILEHKGYKSPSDPYIVPYNYLFIRHNNHFITKADYILSNDRYTKYSPAIPHTIILQYLMPNTLKLIH